nr:acyl carrier protein [Pseudomonas sp. Marseille-Q3773]
MNAIHRLCAEVLNYPELSADQDFFDVGGHSMMMAEIQERLHREHNLNISMETLFRNSNVAALNAMAHAAQGESVS